ncbi:hypothetical protein MMC14_002830 [Varicellaria rhodocarpa]|nr:hypothetical protein [Varicellaria rhodocarpa]
MRANSCWDSQRNHDHENEREDLVKETKVWMGMYQQSSNPIFLMMKSLVYMRMDKKTVAKVTQIPKTA